MQKRVSKGRISSKSTIETLSVSGYGFNRKITDDILKKANQAIKLTAIDHATSLTLLYPFLEEFALKNPGFQFHTQVHNVAKSKV